MKDKVANSRKEILKNLDRIWLLPVAFNLCTKYRSLIAEHKLKMLSKLEKLSLRQDKPLRETNKIAVKTLDGIELPVFVNEMLSYGPKHPVRDKFNEIHFLADVDKLVRSLRENGTSGEKLCEIESTAKWYAKNMRETPIDRGLINVNIYLKFLAVPFDKGNGFCVMKKESYDKKAPRRSQLSAV